jgi:hypothetical protein
MRLRSTFSRASQTFKVPLVSSNGRPLENPSRKTISIFVEASCRMKLAGALIFGFRALFLRLQWPLQPFVTFDLSLVQGDKCHDERPRQHEGRAAASRPVMSAAYLPASIDRPNGAQQGAVSQSNIVI